MTRRLPLWLVLSLAIHATLVIGVLLVLSGVNPPVLFIDLVHGLFEMDEGRTAGRRGDVNGGQTAGSGRPAGPAVAPAPSASSRANAERRAATRSPVAPAVEPPAPMAPPLAPPAPAVVPTAPPPDPVQAVPEPPRAPSEPVLVNPEPAPPSPRTADSGAAAAVPGERGESDGPRAEARGAASGGETGERTGRGPSATGERGRGGSGGGGGPGQGLGARDGSALALAIPGEGGGDGVAEAIYQALHRRLKEALVYPPGAMRRRLAGTVEIVLNIDPTGKITNVVVSRSSSHQILDDAAVTAVRTVDRVPFPANVRPQRLRVRVPLVFNLP